MVSQSAASAGSSVGSSRWLYSPRACACRCRPLCPTRATSAFVGKAANCPRVWMPHAAKVCAWASSGSSTPSGSGAKVSASRPERNRRYALECREPPARPHRHCARPPRWPRIGPRTPGCLPPDAGLRRSAVRCPANAPSRKHQAREWLRSFLPAVRQWFQSGERTAPRNASTPQTKSLPATIAAQHQQRKRLGLQAAHAESEPELARLLVHGKDALQRRIATKDRDCRWARLSRRSSQRARQEPAPRSRVDADRDTAAMAWLISTRRWCCSRQLRPKRLVFCG